MLYVSFIIERLDTPNGTFRRAGDLAFFIGENIDGIKAFMSERKAMFRGVGLAYCREYAEEEVRRIGLKYLEQGKAWFENKDMGLTGYFLGTAGPEAAST